MASIHAALFEWEEARRVLRNGSEELNIVGSSEKAIEQKRSHALIKLVQANIHQAFGEDEVASTLYEECAADFQRFDDGSFAVAALEGFVESSFFLGYSASRDIFARIRDYARTSPEYREAADQERQGIISLAESHLFQAQQELSEALTIAERTHSVRRVRSSRSWYAEVLLRADHKLAALEQFILAGARRRASDAAEEIADSAPLDEEEVASISDGTIDVAFRGDLRAQGAALTALRMLADIVPNYGVLRVAEYLCDLDKLPSSIMEDRDLRSEAGRLAATFMPRFSSEQALAVGEALVRTINTTDGFWTSYRESCLALSSLARLHTEALDRLEVPLDRIEALLDDVISDRHNALRALVNMGIVGHAGARERALGILHTGSTVTHIGWRYLLDDTPEEDVVSAIRNILQGIRLSRVREIHGGTQLSGGVSPWSLDTFKIPQEVCAEVASSLIQAASDSHLPLMHRQAAVALLGSKAEQLDSEGRLRAVEALSDLADSTNIEVHPMLVNTDDPLSGLRFNMGRVEDLRAVAGKTLLALSPWMDKTQRQGLMRRIERLRASREEAAELAISSGLKSFKPKTAEEVSWLNVKLLLLLNSSVAMARRNAALSLGALIDDQAVGLNSDLQYAIALMAASPYPKDRRGAAYVLTRRADVTVWGGESTGELLRRLRNDISYAVRKAVGAGN
jgi:hypothetical protein